jgi:TPR repeat protein/formylglycine-generating enzyme required for sulfatase activity
MYFNGQGVPQNYAEAVKWYRKAADQGNSGSQFGLGLMYAEGQGVPQDYAEAVRWYRKAADQGNFGGQFNLGLMYAKGQGVPQDYQEAYLWFSLSAAQRKTLGNDNTSKNRDLAARFLSPAQLIHVQQRASRWRPKPTPIVSVAPRRKLKVAITATPTPQPAKTATPRPAAANPTPPGSSRRAIRYVQDHLAELGYTPGIIDSVIGPKTRNAIKAFQRDEGLSVTGEVTVELKQKLALRRVRNLLSRRKAQASDEKLASNALATTSIELDLGYQAGVDAYQRGDYASALQEFKPLAEQGDANAQLLLGSMYAGGRGVPQNFAEATKWLRKAAEQGQTGAQILLGKFYEIGQSVPDDVGQSIPQDYAEATKWYRMAADQGVSEAQLNLGFMYGRGGHGVPKDHAEAVMWYRRAAEQGDSRAQAMLGFVYAYGRGVPQDYKEAYFWYLLSVAQGELQNEERDRVAKFLPPAQLIQVQERATKWKPKATPVVSVVTRDQLPPVALRQLADLGTFHALVIGNDTYRALPRLQTAVKDARAVAQLLESRYGFRATTLINASRNQVIQALDVLLGKLTERDNLLIYYAGHGKLDRGFDQGYWLPVDATEGSRINWISNDTITDTLKAIRAQHVMVVSDSCYSGTLTRDTRGIEVRPKKSDYIAKTHSKKSRTVLASGGLEPVSDSGGSGHSVFAKAFMDALRDNQGIIDGLDLFAFVRKQVRLNANQVPNYANIKMAGHEIGGDFLFARKSEHRSEVRQEKPTVAAIRPPPVQQPLSPVKPAVGVFPKTYKPGDTFKDCADCPEMVVIPPGNFRMGSPPSEPKRSSSEGPQHDVRIGYSFAVGKYEVTQAEWNSVFVYDPSEYKGDRNPVEWLRWDGAKEFVKLLSAKTGKTYRLLSEAEWEYVARAGTTTLFNTGQKINLGQANFAFSYLTTNGSHTAPVGRYPANRFGIHDVHGNVWEWVEDCWHADYSNAPPNGEAWTTGGDCTLRVLRGGSFRDFDVRSAMRGRSYEAGSRNDSHGFRIARTLD